VNADGAGEQRVAVAGRLGHLLRADVPAGARPVLDDDGLPVGRAQPIGDQAPEYVGRAAGRERHHQPDGSVWIILRRRGSAAHNATDNTARKSCAQ